MKENEIELPADVDYTSIDIPENVSNKMLFSVSADEKSKTIEIRPMKDGKIILQGADWARQLIQIIRDQSQLLWKTEL